MKFVIELQQGPILKIWRPLHSTFNVFGSNENKCFSCTLSLRIEYKNILCSYSPFGVNTLL